MTKTFSGLEGVVAAQTRLSKVDGSKGELLLAGYPVEDLALNRRFEEVVGLFLNGALPDAAQEEAIVSALQGARARAFERLSQHRDVLGMHDAMDALRAGAARVEGEEPLEVIGALPVLAAGWARKKAGLELIAPSARLGHAEDYLSMLRGAAPRAPEARALERYLCTVVDHGMNASTFTARVVASTESDPISCVVAALGALKGRLHGGAPGPVLDMLDAVKTPEQAAAFVRAELQAGRRIMGMGHRVYRVRDPRATVLERALSALEDAPGAERLALARAVEEEAQRQLAQRYPQRKLKANVEFYTAVLLEALDIPRALFTPTFAVARVVGWAAHVAEQRAEGRLIRPKAEYVGPVHVSPRTS